MECIYPTIVKTEMLTKVNYSLIDKRPKMGLNHSTDIQWYHEQEYVLEDWVKTLAKGVRTSLLRFDLLTWFLTTLYH